MFEAIWAAGGAGVAGAGRPLGTPELPGGATSAVPHVLLTTLQPLLSLLLPPHLDKYPPPTLLDCISLRTKLLLLKTVTGTIGVRVW